MFDCVTLPEYEESCVAPPPAPSDSCSRGSVRGVVFVLFVLFISVNTRRAKTEGARSTSHSLPCRKQNQLGNTVREQPVSPDDAETGSFCNVWWHTNTQAVLEWTGDDFIIMKGFCSAWWIWRLDEVGLCPFSALQKHKYIPPNVLGWCRRLLSEQSWLNRSSCDSRPAGC